MKYSIIIPTYNRAEILQRCLQCICELENRDEHWEVLVFDNNSTDKTNEIIYLYKKRIPNLRNFKTTDPGLHVGRNLGCERAEGDILCYIDDDSFVSRGWLKGIESGFSDPRVALLGGPCLPEYEVKPPKWVEAFWQKTEFGRIHGYLSLVDFGDRAGEILARHVYGCNFNIRKNVLLDCKGFHPDAFPEDKIHYRGDGETAVSRKIEALGYKVFYGPSVKINHLVSCSRMKREYFLHTSYLHGISDSFTEIRQKTLGFGGENQGQQEPGSHMTYEASQRDKICFSMMSIGTLSRFLKGQLGKYKKALLPTEYERIKMQMKISYEAGKKFHKQELQMNPMLLEWVLRENFMGKNGELPI